MQSCCAHAVSKAQHFPTIAFVGQRDLAFGLGRFARSRRSALAVAGALGRTRGFCPGGQRYMLAAPLAVPLAARVAALRADSAALAAARTASASAATVDFTIAHD